MQLKIMKSTCNSLTLEAYFESSAKAKSIHFRNLNCITTAQISTTKMAMEASGNVYIMSPVVGCKISFNIHFP